MIATYLENEVRRQQMLLDVAGLLKDRGRTASEVDVVDLTEVFEATKSGVVRRALAAEGRVLGVRLRGFGGLLKGKLGPELAAHARIAGVGGILHSDELPAFGITEGEVAIVISRLAVEAGDAFVLVADHPERGRKALEEVLRRARSATRGVPEETRDPRPDGTTVYSRPLPGRARMYPETDVPPIRVTKDRLDRLRANLPELPEVRLERIVEGHGIPRQQAEQLLEDGVDELFEAIVSEYGEPQVTANALTYQFPEIRREGLDVDSLPLDRLRGVFRLLRDGAFAKEAVPDVIRRMAREGGTAEAAAKALGLAVVDEAEVNRILDEILAAHEPMIRERGEKAFGPLMGVAMERLRGKIDGRVLSEKLRERIGRVA